MKGARSRTPPFFLFLLISEQPLATATADMHSIDLVLQQRHRVIRVLQVRNQISRRTTNIARDAREFYDRLIEVDNDGVDQRQRPAIVLTRVLSGRSAQHTVGRSAIEDHVVL